MKLSEIMSHGFDVGLTCLGLLLIVGFIELLYADDRGREYNYARALAIPVLLTAVIWTIVWVIMYIA